jgi:hypothetical protein
MGFLNLYDGYVFYCTNKTRQECLINRQFRCVDKKTRRPETIKVNSVIFLYNTQDRTLLGPFTALTEDASELDSGAWRMDVETHIPSENIKVTWEDLHIIHDAPVKLPFLLNPRTCRLGFTQTQRVLDILKQGKLYLYSEERDEEEREIRV